MKKLILGLTVAGLVGISGCGGDGPKEPTIPDGVPGEGTTAGAVTRPVFAPGNGNIPLPNDLLFNGTTDLTLNVPVDDVTDFSDPKVAISALDGWSAIAPFAIAFDNPEDTDLDPSTIIPGSTIRVFEANVERAEAIPGTGVPVPTGPVTGVSRELTAGVDFFATYAGPLTAAVIPLKPLTPQKTYMVVVTTGVKDANGNNVVPDFQYAIAKTTDPITGSGPTAALEPVRQLVNAMEAASGIPSKDIALSYQFTVQSLGQVVAANKRFYIDLPLSMGAAPQTSFSSLMTSTAPFTGIGAANLYKGSINLNYFLGVPGDLNSTTGLLNDTGVIQTFFTGNDMIPNPAYDPETEGSQPMIPNPFAGGMTTYANPLVKRNGVEQVPLLVSLPSHPACVKPAEGYPVTIFQHGVTADRTNMIGLADAMAAPPSCRAMVAMDMPMHGIAADNRVHLGLQQASGGLIGLFEGYTSTDSDKLRERTFGLDLVNNEDGKPKSDGVADTSGRHMINLSNLLVARDNNRQAALDLLTLEKAIPTMDVDGGGADFDVNNVAFVGHSWGGIVGSIFLANSDYVKVAVLANSGGNLMGMIDGSERFGTPVKAALAAGGIPTGSPAYKQFLFAGQTAIDDGDAINSISANVSNQIPTLIFQVAGDNVVPNAVATSPTAGTQPMAALLGTIPVAATEDGEMVAGSRLFTRLNSGLHSTFLTPMDADGNPTLLDVTTEMQTQAVSFIASGGAGVKVVKVDLLD